MLQTAEGDLVVSNAMGTQIEGGEDVFIQTDAAPNGVVSVSEAEDVQLVGENGDLNSVYRDTVLTDGSQVSINGDEDIGIQSGAVGENLHISSVEDVFIEPCESIELFEVHNVTIESNAIDGGEVFIGGGQSVTIAEDGVRADVSVVGASGVDLDEDAVTGDVTRLTRDEAPDTFKNSRGHLELSTVGEVSVDQNGIDGNLVVVTDEELDSDDAPSEDADAE